MIYQVFSARGSGKKNFIRDLMKNYFHLQGFCGKTNKGSWEIY